MSLQVWLPLDGNLENLGLDDIEFTNTTVSEYEDGKIGKALQMKDSNVFFTAPSLTDAKVFSVAFWYKAISDSTITASFRRVLSFDTKNTDGTTGSLFRFESSYGDNYTNRYALSVHNNTSQSLGTVGHQIIALKDEWHHACFTHTPEQNLTYLDGVLKTTGVGAAGTINGTIRISDTSAGSDPNGLMNDLRIYDHCLSQKEVKELSKGLIGHWPLNDMVGGENLIKNTTITTTAMGWAKAGTSVTTITVSNGITTFSNTESTALQYTRMCQWIDDGAWSTVNGKTITVSFDIYSDDWDSVHEVNGANSGFAGFAIQICRSTAAPGSGSTQQQQYRFARLNDTTFWNVPTKENGKWIHFVSKPFVINEANLNSSATLTSGDYIHIGWQLRMQGVVKVKNLKVEYGSAATPWTPAPTDDLYSAMGLDEGVIYDTSGYGRNGSVSGTITADSDTPRYSVRPLYSSTTASFQGGSIDLHNQFGHGSTYTLACWAKPTGLNSSGYVIRLGGNNCGLWWAKSEARWVWNENDNGKRCANPTISGDYDNWHHIVNVVDKTTPSATVVKHYVDGEFADGYNSHTFDASSLTQPTSGIYMYFYNAHLSDVRLYSTALSADDIKELYETAASVDNNGNFHAYEISEL